MKGDFTRDTFDASNHFTRVLMQQGRAQLDADLNEQTAILLHYLQTLAVDLGGRYWGPDGEDLGFEISSIENDSGNFTIGRGHYYVDGLLVENENPLKYRDQNSFAAMPLPEFEKSYYVYLDVWERHLTYVQDDRIRETALGMGGPDTCTRAQVVWQVRLDEVPTDGRSNCEGTEYWINSKTMTSQVTVKARLQSEHSDTNACIIPPDSHYRGAENSAISN